MAGEFLTFKETAPGRYLKQRTYNIYTGNPEDPARRWTTNLKEESDVFLMNPRTGERRSSNWDDHGEVVAYLDVNDTEYGYLLSVTMVAYDTSVFRESVLEGLQQQHVEMPGFVPMENGGEPERDGREGWLTREDGGKEDIRVKLNIWNGGGQLNFDGGASGDPPATPIPDEDKVALGAYLLVNWDNDDGIGVLDADERPPWEEEPVPDLERDSVINENNLARLQPAIESIPEYGKMELEMSGVDAGKIKLWKYSNKGTETTLVSGKKIWNLANAPERDDFLAYLMGGCVVTE